MRFQTLGDKKNPAVIFFHAMGVTGASSEPVARCLRTISICSIRFKTHRALRKCCAPSQSRTVCRTFRLPESEKCV